ncbi:MTH1187 family thiamine-binding protein [Candidatus Sumerlaeota bacterium]|nr:MTH1187 family thiamine-binding protein [Candidatus Sumerlaeota bacterium]
MIAEFSTFPVGKGVHLSKYVAPIIKMIENSGLDYKMTPMGTIVEGDADRVFDLIRACHKKLARDSKRVITSIRIDDFKDRSQRITKKIESVEKRLGHKVKQ